jgi:hypothetical protein
MTEKNISRERQSVGRLSAFVGFVGVVGCGVIAELPHGTKKTGVWIPEDDSPFLNVELQHHTL